VRELIASLSHEILLPGDTLNFDYAIFASGASGTALTPADSTHMLRIAKN